MNSKAIVTAVLLVFVMASVVVLLVNETRRAKVEETGGDMHTADDSGRKVVMYYFHGTKRCVTCKKFEVYATELMRTNFTEQQVSGKLEFHIVNVDEPENGHFVHDYQLTTKAIVLADIQDGELMRYKNLDRIWQLVGDRSMFDGYIKDETQAFMGDLLYE